MAPQIPSKMATAANSGDKSNNMTAEQAGVPNEAAAYLKSLEDPEVVERVRCTIADAHVFKLPHRPTAGGWRGADWDTEVWQGSLKVVERGDLTVILLVARANPTAIFAVCPVKDGAVDRCVDSSRYFVLRVENDKGRHMYIGLAFNERNDAFDFNTSLEDSRREREAESKLGDVKISSGPAKDYSMKQGEKIHINVKKISGYGGSDGKRHASVTSGSSGDGRAQAASDSSGTQRTMLTNPKGASTGKLFLKASSKDTPVRRTTESDDS